MWEKRIYYKFVILIHEVCYDENLGCYQTCDNIDGTFYMQNVPTILKNIFFFSIIPVKNELFHMFFNNVVER